MATLRARRWTPWPVPAPSLHSGLPGPGLGQCEQKPVLMFLGRRVVMSESFVPWSYCNHFVRSH